MEHGAAGESRLLEQAELLVVGGDELGPIAGLRKGQTRMFLETDDDGLQTSAGCFGLYLLDEVEMDAVYTIEKSDG